jgi:hypothetical protein
MTGRMAFSLAVLAAALAAVGIVAGPDLFGGSDDKGGGSRAKPALTTTSDALGTSAPEIQKPKPKPVSKPKPLPENPDDLAGTDPRSLTRAANLKRALAVLEGERQRSEGVFDGLRVAPGRIDTTIDSAERKLSIQIRPDFKIAFRADSKFPNANNPRWRRNGLGARAVDATVPQRMLRRIDRARGGSAAGDIDYFVIRRDVIDHHVGYGAYFKRGPRPRIVTLEPNGTLRSVQ